MKTLYLTGGYSNIVVDPETEYVNKLEPISLGIDSAYFVEEPMHVIYGKGEYKRELDVKKGDIIITFYSGRFKHQVVVVKSKDWAENIKVLREKEQEEKERWASANIGDTPCENCKSDL